MWYFVYLVVVKKFQKLQEHIFGLGIRLDNSGKRLLSQPLVTERCGRKFSFSLSEARCVSGMLMVSLIT